MRPLVDVRGHLLLVSQAAATEVEVSEFRIITRDGVRYAAELNGTGRVLRAVQVEQIESVDPEWIEKQLANSDIAVARDLNRNVRYA